MYLSLDWPTLCLCWGSLHDGVTSIHQFKVSIALLFFHAFVQYLVQSVFSSFPCIFPMIAQYIYMFSWMCYVYWWADNLYCIVAPHSFVQYIVQSIFVALWFWNRWEYGSTELEEHVLFTASLFAMFYAVLCFMCASGTGVYILINYFGTLYMRLQCYGCHAS